MLTPITSFIKFSGNVFLFIHLNPENSSIQYFINENYYKFLSNLLLQAP